MPLRHRAALACGIAAPACFVAAWVTGGLLRNGYDPVEEAISQLAREGSTDRAVMTAGFVGFGVLLPVFARTAAKAMDAPGMGAAMTVAAVGTLAVAGLPLAEEPGGLPDLLHAVAAGTGYVGQIVAPALGAAAFARRGHSGAAKASGAVAATSAAALLLSITVGPTGLWQRTGLTVVDCWYAGVATWLLRRG
ncbi:MAG TPA: DUF998 domain-containing protein [Mycobacteriales bacterium]|nr:DUF998 domain-containing protein [Mycobacteriales bacterium]